MNIGIDWDGTITEDPQLFWAFAELAKNIGHTVYVVTGRPSSHPIEDDHWFSDIEFIYTDGEYKKQYCEAQGINIDVWIDNEPGYIEPGRKLDWENGE